MGGIQRLILFALIVVVGCGSQSHTGPDASDGHTNDSGPVDSGSNDGGPNDGPTHDGGTVDSGPVGSGPPDSGPSDSGPIDRDATVADGGDANTPELPAPCLPIVPTSGTRLRARVAITSEGDRALLGWYDSERDEDCWIAEASDGTLRCFQPGTLVSPNKFPLIEKVAEPSGVRLSSLIYESEDGMRQSNGWIDAEGDRACKPALADDGHQRCLPTEFLSASGLSTICNAGATLYSKDSFLPLPDVVRIDDTCDRLSHFAERGAAPPFVYEHFPDDGGGDCASYDNTGAAERQYARGDDIPAEAFVAVRSEIVDDEGRLKPMVQAADDGACWFDGWYDSELETRCEFKTMTDRVVRCVPLSDPYTSFRETYYVDEGCTQEWGVLAERGRLCVDDEYAYSAWGDSVRPVGAAIEVSSLPPLWFATLDGCYLADFSEWVEYLILGPELEASALMAAEVEIE